MSTKAKGGLAVGSGIAILAVLAFFLMGGREASPFEFLDPEPQTCPLSGVEPARESRLDRPAVAVKVENASIAYPLSGLEDAEIVYEELVEGGMTRFMAIYHCTDSSKVGPVRSTRFIDPAIAIPITRILAGAGGNAHVREALDAADMVLIDEPAAGEAMTRVPREGVSSEHTLYGNTSQLRRIGKKSYDDPPPEDMFTFGDLEVRGRKATTVTLNFSSAGTVTYRWQDGKYLRFDGDEPLMMESGEQIAVDNVILEMHTINLSRQLVDVIGTPSIEIADETGSGKAVLFRDGRAVVGTWTRKDVDNRIVFTAKNGDEMTLKPGSTWIELLPNDKGEVKGSFSYEK